MNKKLSNKDKKDWKNFIGGKEKLLDKDKFMFRKNVNLNLFETIDLHGLSLDDANKKIADDMSAKLGSLSGGMSLPPGMKLPF